MAPVAMVSADAVTAGLAVIVPADAVTAGPGRGSSGGCGDG